MPGLNTITLLLSGLTLPLGLSFLLIVLWSDRRQERNRFFAAFLLFVCLWNAGSFMVQALTLLDMPASRYVPTSWGKESTLVGLRQGLLCTI